MPPKTLSIISSVITIILLLLTGIALFFLQLVLLNGFSEREATPSLVVGLVCQGIGLLLSAILAWKLTGTLAVKFNWNGALAVFISVLAGVILGGGLGFVSLFLSIAVADGM